MTSMARMVAAQLCVGHLVKWCGKNCPADTDTALTQIQWYAKYNTAGLWGKGTTSVCSTI